MDLSETSEDWQFRAEVRQWLDDNLTEEFADARGLGGPGREHEALDVRLAWERHLGAAGWTCLGLPAEHGGRGLSLAQQVIFYEEYAQADAPVRLGVIGEGMVAPTLVAYGTEDQRRRFLPGIIRGEQFWAQGYSEPGAGSDLANISTRAERDGDEFVLTGQKVWTSLAHISEWAFVLARTEPGSRRHHGLSYLLVPMQQPGVDIRPIQQITGTSEFNEVFFDGARTSVTNVVGEVGGGWRVGLATLAFERGTMTLGQQVGFRRELSKIIELARQTGAIEDPLIRDRLCRAWIDVEIMRLNNLRALADLGSDGSAPPGPTASIGKLFWSHWHRDLGELAMDVLGVAGLVADDAPYDLSDVQRLFLFTRSDTIYAGSSEIQKNIIAQSVLGLPRG
jgi:alkylation response protein AidB-like acyl-CoA dehydrogenase